MAFDSLAEFMVMDGHGVYVWACYAIALVVLGINVLSTVKMKKQLIKDDQRRQRRATR